MHLFDLANRLTLGFVATQGDTSQSIPARQHVHLLLLRRQRSRHFLQTMQRSSPPQPAGPDSPPTSRAKARLQFKAWHLRAHGRPESEEPERKRAGQKGKAKILEARRCVRSLAFCLVAFPDTCSGTASSLQLSACADLQLLLPAHRKLSGRKRGDQQMSARSPRQQFLSGGRTGVVGSKDCLSLRAGDCLHIYATSGRRRKRRDASSQTTLHKLTWARRPSSYLCRCSVREPSVSAYYRVACIFRKEGRPRQETLRYASTNAERRSRRLSVRVPLFLFSVLTLTKDEPKHTAAKRDGKVYNS